MSFLQGLLKYLGCLQKLADPSGACGKRKTEFNALEQAFGIDHKHKSDREKKGLCCKYSSYVDCYMKNVRHSCGDSAGKYALKFIESSTQKYVRNACHKFDKPKVQLGLLHVGLQSSRPGRHVRRASLLPAAVISAALDSVVA
ncbi:hypothetical protein HPB50_011037 [Hyalomma asiaticum]|uniref:Uncharacterized protein n=1 Tax=Hyalomma asiaticum TaxID=266040 RepID=A0ACB7RKD7_HYAAI|nr:hypothetical protein HPB50_011037 [Hyalomma asiaticum]